MNITRGFCFLFLLTLGTGAYAQEEQAPAVAVDTLVNAIVTDEKKDEAKEVIPPHDSTVITARSMDPARLRQMQEDPEMDYGQDSPAVVGLWDRLMMWLLLIIRWLFFMGESTDWGNVIVGILVVGILGYVILRLLKIDAMNLLRSKSRSTLHHAVLEENIHEMDFEKLIADALTGHAYRLAIRLTFLYSLKLLSDRQHIHWEPGKTNHDYLRELSAPDLKAGFRELNFYFENAWYGNFVITGEHYQRVNNIFNTWKTNVR
jgi:hypothetical protein